MNDSKVKKQIIEKIKDSNNVLVALNKNPTVDELSAALGVTLAINKIDKHATAVFSGTIPQAIEFLEPEKTFENSVLSLQDFIIALDKEKADHLRYKVDGDMVKIFITPYRTTIDESDLEFSQGDYNVDFVLAIGVQSAVDLDKALESHGQILEDATVASVSLDESSELGAINWNDKNASSYCELLTSLVKDLRVDKSVLDEQIATALLTGIVAATDRFSNEKTSSRVMTTAAELMSAGANQQLIAVQLEQADAISSRQAEPEPEAASSQQESAPNDNKNDQQAEAEHVNGELSIPHMMRGGVDDVAEQVAQESQTEAAREAQAELNSQLHPPVAPLLPPIQGAVDYEETPMARPSQQPQQMPAPQYYQEQEQAEPSLGGTLNATTEEAAEDKRRELERDQNKTILSHDSGRYITEQPQYQAPLSATAASTDDEPEVRDIFADNSPLMQSQKPSPAIHDLHSSPLPDFAQPAEPAPMPSSLPPLPSMQPQMTPPPMAPISPQAAFAPAPMLTNDEPTLAEIDAQNRMHGDIMNELQNAYASQPPQVGGMGMPPLPPMPPMPDMSTLPPLPNSNTAMPSMPPSQFGTMGIQADPLGSSLPPAPMAPEPTKPDPQQFRIPGMPS